MKKFALSFLLDVPAKKLAGIAFAIWLCSLPLPGIELYFHMYSEKARIYGYNILATGWLSPLMGNFSWFANLFFLYGVLKLIAGRPATTSSIIAAVLSLDTFRFDHVLMNEGGSTSPVYGYGWGAVLWLLSQCILMAAAGKRNIEIAKESNNANRNGWLHSLGVVLFVVMICTVAYFAVYDRTMGNNSENRRLSGIAFKRGKICHAPDPVATDPIHNFSGILEIVVDENKIKRSHANYPFGQIKELMSWGIPAVRFYGGDYSDTSGLSRGIVTSTPAVGAPTAILYIDGDDWKVNAKLVEVASNRLVFDQTWEREPLYERSNFHFCPDYRSFPSQSEQPRKLITQALGLAN